MTTNISQAQVRRFFENLKMAVYDKHLERSGYRLMIYIDADVAVRMVAGFEERGGTEQENLARALISCGFLGPVRILRPHALELYDYISSWAKEEKVDSETAFWDRVEHFLSENKLSDQLLEIVESAHGELADVEASVQFVEKLRVAGVNAFLAFEKALGPWPRRLRRLYGNLLRLDQPGPDIRQLLGETVNIVDRAMEALRATQGARPYRSVASDYRDACAIGALHWLRRRDEREVRQERVRFYTETPVVRSIILDPNGLARDLSYETDLIDAEGIGPEPRRILREADYFLMRCRFRQLSVDATEPADELAALIHGIEDREILRLKNSQLQGALKELEVEGQSLESIISEFEDLSLLRAIWSGRVPEAVLTSLPKWGEVVAILRNDRTVDLVSDRIEDIQGDLSRHVERISAWMDDFQHLTRVAKDHRARRTEGFGSQVPEAAEALLGMRRWGIVLDGAAEAVNVLDRIAGEPGSLDSVRSCQHVATMLERAKTRTTEAAYVSAILWGLGDYARIVTLLTELEDNQELTISLKLLKYAASLRGDLLIASGSKWLIEWERILKELEEEIRKAPLESRAGLEIGLAYILFHMAVRGLARAGIDSEVKAACEEWKTRSIVLGEGVKRELREDTLEWALAVNHIAYVLMRTGGEVDRIMENIIPLRRFERKAIGSARIWNARFSDTITCYYIWRFNRMKNRGDLQILRSDLDNGRKYLEEARRWNIGDIAVPEHESELERAELELEELERG